DVRNVEAWLSVCRRLGLDARRATLGDVDAALAAVRLEGAGGPATPNPPPPPGPGVPLRTLVGTLCCTQCPYVERCPQCDTGGVVPPFALVAHAGEGLR